jgi:hypothetical protein
MQCDQLALRSNSQSGYCHNFHVDTRQQTVSDMVSAVCAPQPSQPFRIATDRFYTSVRNARTLLERGLYMYGAVRSVPRTLKATE